jgi:hypothetical protein
LLKSRAARTGATCNPKKPAISKLIPYRGFIVSPDLNKASHVPQKATDYSQVAIGIWLGLEAESR